MEVNINLTRRQTEAWKLLFDDHTVSINYGGAAGGGKSFLGCLWLATICLRYDGIRCLLGRTVLATLKQTSLNTLFQVLQSMGLKGEQHYTYNGQSNIITFKNGSEILLKDLEYKPSDPNFDGLGGLEITAAFIDEANQIGPLAYSIVKSRIRYKLNEYNLIPKIFLTCNPANNWIKKEFYLPWIQDTLDSDKSFVPALPLDNPHLPQSYLDLLQTLPPQQKRRLLEGDWNYLDDSNSLFNFDHITNSVFKDVPHGTSKRYISVDVGRFGDDRSVAVVWDGLVVLDIKIYRKLSTTELSSQIKELIGSYGVHINQVIVDSDGVGGGVADQLRGCVNFVNNSKALHEQNFINLKSQCYVKLAELFKEGKISLNILEPSIVEDLTQELLAVKLKDIDKDNKVAVQSKDEMKKVLGKSPDLSDALMMRIYWEVKNLKSTGRYAIARF